jgi:hypothetical protein
MTKQVLSIEQMQHLQELGLDIRILGEFYHDYIKGFDF